MTWRQEGEIKGGLETQKRKRKEINLCILVQAASSSTQLSVFAVLDALQESKPCRQAAICHLGSCPTLRYGAKMAPSNTESLKQRVESLESKKTCLVKYMKKILVCIFKTQHRQMIIYPHSHHLKASVVHELPLFHWYDHKFSFCAEIIVWLFCLAPQFFCFILKQFAL